MVKRVGSGEITPHHRGPEPRKPISKELRENIADTKAVAAKFVFQRLQEKSEGYTKGSANIKSDKKADKVFKKYLPK